MSRHSFEQDSLEAKGYLRKCDWLKHGRRVIKGSESDYHITWTDVNLYGFEKTRWINKRNTRNDTKEIQDKLHD